jgi:hypothetical protein
MKVNTKRPALNAAFKEFQRLPLCSPASSNDRINPAAGEPRNGRTDAGLRSDEGHNAGGSTRTFAE